eukprot:366529-Chlamydomonas_euryale.AAC.14
MIFRAGGGIATRGGGAGAGGGGLALLYRPLLRVCPAGRAAGDGVGTAASDESSPPLVIDCVKLAEEPLGGRGGANGSSCDGGGGNSSRGTSTVGTGAGCSGGSGGVAAGCDMSLVVRMYEPYGCRGVAKLVWNPAALHVTKV